MTKKISNICGWMLVVGIAFLWIVYGYLDWYLLLLPAAYLCFSISDGSIKKLKKLKKLSVRQTMIIIFSFIASVAIVFVLIQLANILINDWLQLQGWVKTCSQFIAVIVSLYPVKFTFGSVLYKVNEDVEARFN